MQEKRHNHMTTLELDRLLAVESVACFGLSDGVPKSVRDKEVGRSQFYWSTTAKPRDDVDDTGPKLGALNEISRFGATVTFLDNEAAKVLVAKYPNNSKYVLVRLRPTLTSVYALIGLVRRISKRMVAVHGVREFVLESGKSSRWLVIENVSAQVQSPIYLSIREDLGSTGLINFLNESNIRYVIPRFFEKFPALNRPSGGDIDVLVADEDAPNVRNFLRENPGRIPVDLHTVYGPAPGSGDMPYYLPSLANSMLNNATTGPIGARIPSPKDYFYSFIYHILFHKGFFAGIPSAKFPGAENSRPENDYKAHLLAIANKAEMKAADDLEALERILAEVNYVPKLDTLAAISRLNKWVRWNYFAGRKVQEIGLSVVILKEIASINNWVDEIEDMVRQQGFEIIEKKVLTDPEVDHFARTLRGGNWYVKSERKEYYLPRTAYILIDRKQSVSTNARSGTKHARIRLLKTSLRAKYDESLDSFIHATDDTEQSWEYIEDIWPDKYERLRDNLLGKVEAGTPERKSLTLAIQTMLHNVKERLKDKILNSYE